MLLNHKFHESREFNAAFAALAQNQWLTVAFSKYFSVLLLLFLN